MKAAKIISGVGALFITMPIWFYLLYKMLEGINASELTWFLFWVYVPSHAFVGIVSRLAADGK